MTRGAESRTWARGHLKYNGFPVVWTPKQTEKMPLQKSFYRNSNVFQAEIKWFWKKRSLFPKTKKQTKKKGFHLQKKKVFTEILTIFPAEIKWTPKKKKQKKKKVIKPHMPISYCHLSGPFWNPWAPKSPWAPGSLFPLPPLSLALVMTYVDFTFCSRTDWLLIRFYCIFHAICYALLKIMVFQDWQRESTDFPPPHIMPYYSFLYVSLHFKIRDIFPGGGQLTLLAFHVVTLMILLPCIAEESI